MKNRRERGSEILEFALVVVPLLAMLTIVIDVGWSIFVKATLQRAVRVGVTTGITLTQSQIVSGCLTDNLKTIVQANSFGMLAGSSGLSAIKVNYFLPPPSNSTGPLTDVSSATNGNSPGNILQISVANYSILPLISRIVSLQQGPDGAALTTSVYSAGMIEPSSNVPCIGAAP